MMNESKRNYNSNDWLIDSGCSRHMTGNKNLLTNIRSVHTNVSVADGRIVKCKLQGDIKVITQDNKDIIIQNVLFVPTLIKNLLSVSTLEEKGTSVMFKNHICTIINKQNEIVCKGKKINNTYRIKLFIKDEVAYNVINEVKTNIDDLWHQRYGHINMNDLKLMREKDIVNGLNDNLVRELECSTCIKGKQIKSSYKKNEDKTNKYKNIKIGELIVSDVCGPFQVSSINNYKYFVSFIDVKSNYTSIYLMKSKTEVLDCIKKFISFINNQTGNKVKIFRSDNGTEYVNANAEKYFENKGIIHQLTNPYTPEQNGKAERMNRTLVEMARCLLIQGKLPMKFWEFAITTSTYLRNLCVSSTTNKQNTPYEMLFNFKPNVSHF